MDLQLEKTVAQSREELAMLRAFVKTDAYADYAAEIDAKKHEVDQKVYGMVPQTLGDMNDREQMIGLGGYLMDIKDWFATRIQACEEHIKAHDSPIE